LSGAVNGTLHDVTPLCNQAQRPGNEVRPYVQVTGQTGSSWFRVQVFDPTTGGDWESASHVIVTQTDERPTSTSGANLSTWLAPSRATQGISNYATARGAQVNATLPPADLQEAGTNQSQQPLSVAATIACT
jgi:hypothetical protein